MKLLILGTTQTQSLVLVSTKRRMRRVQMERPGADSGSRAVLLLAESQRTEGVWNQKMSSTPGCHAGCTKQQHEMRVKKDMISLYLLTERMSSSLAQVPGSTRNLCSVDEEMGISRVGRGYQPGIPSTL